MGNSIRVALISFIFCFSVGTANAVDVDKGTLSPGGNFSQFFSPGQGAFLDHLQFDLQAPGFIGSTVSLPLGNIYSISYLSLSLYAGAIGAPDTHLAAPIATFTQVNEGASFNFGQSLASGIYHFDIAGVANGPAGGLYTVAIAAVPEPEVYAMLLVGLGLVGFTARRRKQNLK